MVGSWRGLTGVLLGVLWLTLFLLSYQDLSLCYQNGTVSGTHPPGPSGANDGCAALEWVYLLAVGLGALSILWLRSSLMIFFGRKRPRV
jgi:hypothetical protein